MLIQMAASIAIGHHEKWDGSGYPRGLAGESIPIEARIVAVADIFDALTTARPYKEPWPLDKVCDHLQTLAGSHLDPAVVEAFLRQREAVAEVMETLRD
jgi:putative two-component system response regulator